MKRFACLLLAVLLTVSLCGCGGTQESRLELFAMDTYMVITAEGGDTEEAVKSVSREISRLENALSRTIDTSSVSRLNTEGSAVLDEDTTSLLAAALTYSEETGGAFDVTIAPLVSLWGITSDDPQVPTQEEIDALLPLVGGGHIRLDGQNAALDEGCGTVGTRLELEHSAPTPVGMTVTCESELVAVEGRKLVFKVSLHDEKGPVGGGTHERFVINNAKFAAKAESKKG